MPTFRQDPKNRIASRLTIAFLPVIVFATARAVFPVVTNSNQPLCVFRIMTGKPCLFCGLTRAFAYASHGDLAAAAHFHPFWWLFAGLIIGISVLAWIDIFHATNRVGQMWRKVPLVWAVAMVLVLSILRWIVGF
jgi:hypothetical protein